MFVPELIDNQFVPLFGVGMCPNLSLGLLQLSLPVLQFILLGGGYFLNLSS